VVPVGSVSCPDVLPLLGIYCIVVSHRYLARGGALVGLVELAPALGVLALVALAPGAAVAGPLLQLAQLPLVAGALPGLALPQLPLVLLHKLLQLLLPLQFHLVLPVHHSLLALRLPVQGSHSCRVG